MTTRFAMDAFAGGALSVDGAGGSAAAAAAAPKNGLAALAARAGMGKIGAAFTQLGGAFAGLSGDSDPGGGAVVDHGDDEDDAGGRAGANAGSGGGGGGGGAIGRTTSGGFSRHDKATADLMRARGMSGQAIAANPVLPPPTLAELLKGKRKM